MAVPARRVRTDVPAKRAAKRPGPGRRVTPARPSSRRTTARPSPHPRRVPFVLVSLVVVGAMVMALVSMQALVAQRSFQVQELQRQAEELSSEYERLQFQLAKMSMPARIQEAAAKAGLVLHERVQVLEVPRSERGGRGLASAGGPHTVKAALGAGG